MKIYGRGRRSAQSSSHGDRSNGDSHHAKISSRLVKTIPVFFIAFLSKVKVSSNEEVSGY
jgi:hypothetical protein